MKICVWRIVRRKHLDAAFSGEGALNFGGRWNNKGTAIVYCSGNLSLAALEMLVHLESVQILNTYLSICVEFDESLILELSTKNLPTDWREDPIPISTMNVGDAWVDEAKSAVLKVPSVVVPGESNYLLNPLHSDFDKLKVSKAEVFEFDKRLVY